MKTPLILFFYLLLSSASLLAEEQPDMKLGLYVVVDDMPVAEQFYRQLFQREPVFTTNDFVSFRINGGIFALYDKTAYSHNLTLGNNAIPYIQVGNIEQAFERVKALSPQMLQDKVIDEGAIKLFMFTDPSGNHIEFYSLQ